MAVPGAKPRADRSQIRHRVPAVHEWTEVDNVPFDGPPLPARGESSATSVSRPLGEPADSWPPATAEWWEAVRTMPHAAKWTRAEWQTARAAAETHARFIEGWRGCASGAELRAREKQLGMTADARRDLRIRYVEPKPDTEPAPSGVARLDDYRGL